MKRDEVGQIVQINATHWNSWLKILFSFDNVPIYLFQQNFSKIHQFQKG